MAVAGIALASLTALPIPSSAQLSAQPQQQAVSSAIARWEYLEKTRGLSFSQYSEFALSYPNFPRMGVIRGRAENALKTEAVPLGQIIRYFDRQPPLSNYARGAYALALASAQRTDAFEVAREAWRGGTMSPEAETYLRSFYGSRFSADDHRARADALMWQGDANGATRQMIYLSPADRDIAMARLAFLRGSRPGSVPAGAMSDAGYVFNYINYLRSKRLTGEAVRVLSNRSAFSAPAFDPEDFVGDMLAIADAASSSDTVRIANRIDDLFEPGTDVSKGSFKLRDRYTDLMWKGGTNALWRMSDGASAAPLFERYGNAARTPLTKSKGYYWAGRAAQRAGMTSHATRFYERAAAYPHYYYGQLSLAALGRPMPQFAAVPQADPSMRASYNNRPLTMAIRSIAANRRDWRTERRFFQAVGDAAKTPQEMALAHELASQVGLPEMSVVLGMKAGENKLTGLERVGFPIIGTPTVNDWTMTHAIARQESEFDRTRQSHAGARGIMQLMPGTAREQAGKLGLSYSASALFNDPSYNIRLGDSYFNRMLRYYNGSYPLAIAAYNAGPGNVNKWLRAHGDPRTGGADWQVWIERIKFTETRYYVMRVLGNAVSYSHMYPQQAGVPREVNTMLR
ncbi:MAG: lytic transglycosylase domain-containing protein [Erythrobacter sp.]